MPEHRDSNPRAASVRIQPKRAGAYAGQRRHDLRRGALPSYVDPERVALNEVIMAPPPPGELRAENERRRRRRDTRRAMRSDAAVAFIGVLTLGAEAQALFNRLPPARQRVAFEDAGRAVARRLNTTLAGLIVHRDETAAHAHFVLPAYDETGHPLTATVKRGTLSALQDDVAAAFSRHAPGIERGQRVAARRAAGAEWRETAHRTVRQLHADLPADLAAARAKVAEAEARAAEMSARVDGLREKAELSAAEVKRLATYERRLNDRTAALEAAQAEAERVAAALTGEAQADRAAAAVEREAAEQERGALRKAVAAVKALARRYGLTGPQAEAVVQEAEGVAAEAMERPRRPEPVEPGKPGPDGDGLGL